uniref:Glucose-1-phosphate cytidylyltransferase (CDP-glucose pyrophosphorylase) n=1 Tax=mine drainage metagenome TaxID=410659 RepID=E6PD84_9ZZZZ
MVEIGGRPIIWHLMNLYARAGFNEFIIACGYKQEIIKDYFRSIYASLNDLTVDFSSGGIEYHVRSKLDWKVHVVDTGLSTMTGGRVKRCQQLIGNEPFLCTYGDGLAALDISDVLSFHRNMGREATVTAVRPPARFGVLAIDDDRVVDFSEKPQTAEGWINGGFFVFEPSIFDRIGGDSVLLEQEPLMGLARDGQLAAYRHNGFWQPMDTMRDKRHLEDLWESGSAPWTTL